MPFLPVAESKALSVVEFLDRGEIPLVPVVGTVVLDGDVTEGREEIGELDVLEVVGGSKRSDVVGLDGEDSGDGEDHGDEDGDESEVAHEVGLGGLENEGKREVRKDASSERKRREKEIRATDLVGRLLDLGIPVLNPSSDQEQSDSSVQPDERVGGPHEPLLLVSLSAQHRQPQVQSTQPQHDEGIRTRLSLLGSTLR